MDVPISADSVALSVLDLVPVRSGQSTGEAVAASVRLAQTADRTGYRRYWLAEHHNMPAVAATNPPVLIATVAAATERIRVGSGGVMLPNHAPLVVAEQFALLEAVYPDRIDLGIGRAPGSDPVTNYALRYGSAGVREDAVGHFDEYVADVIAMLSPEGVLLQTASSDYPLRATPQARSTPPVWLLGSSEYSARLAARTGLPYVFAHHFGGGGTAEALALYRQGFTPSDQAAAPATFLTVNAVVAETAEEAERLVRPQLLAMVALRTGGRLQAQLDTEEAARTSVAPEHLPLFDRMRAGWLIGTPDDVARRVGELARTYDVDEVMLNPVAGANPDDPVDRSPGREDTLELLAAALG